MIKFNAFPPEPTDVEFAAGSGMTPEEAQRIGRLSFDAYVYNGAIVGHVLVANMINPTEERVITTLMNMTRSYEHASETVIGALRYGAMNAKFAREEVGHV
jgi:hypothetical protein